MGDRPRAVEALGLKVIDIADDFWRGRRVFLTGHTGFKGSWLSLWLQALGVELHGFALTPPTTPSLFDEARVHEGMSSTIGDVRDQAAVLAAMQSFRPDIVIHMAAQPLVRLSYKQPVETYSINVMGTVHVLDAARHVDSVRAIVNVTTDKCYENKEWIWSYREDEPLGGHDPYSNSKACSELVTAAYRKSFLTARRIAVASARAGNVIGGGDWALDRLLPDILRAFERNQPVHIRNAGAVRPWQHVLEPLSGYLMLARALFDDQTHHAEAWNFGPREADTRNVKWIVENLAQRWGKDARWVVDGGAHPHEAHHLKLDIAKAGSRLGWHPCWPLEAALGVIVDWHRGWLAKEDVRDLCLAQIVQYMQSMTKEPA